MLGKHIKDQCSKVFPNQKVKCPKKEKEEETKFNLALHAEGKNKGNDGSCSECYYFCRFEQYAFSCSRNHVLAIRFYCCKLDIF